MTTTETQPPALRHRCPTCGQGPGQPCVTRPRDAADFGAYGAPTGQPETVEIFHTRRRHAAMED